jgi:hypothetical protein
MGGLVGAAVTARSFIQWPATVNAIISELAFSGESN